MFWMSLKYIQTTVFIICNVTMICTQLNKISTITITNLVKSNEIIIIIIEKRQT